MLDPVSCEFQLNLLLHLSPHKCLFLKMSILCQDKSVSFLLQNKLKGKIYSVSKKCRQLLRILEWQKQNFHIVFLFLLVSSTVTRLINVLHWYTSDFDFRSKSPFPMRESLNLVRSPQKSGFQLNQTTPETANPWKQHWSILNRICL